MSDLGDYHRLIGTLRASGLSEPEAHATAEQLMEDAIQTLHDGEGANVTPRVRD